MRNSSPTRESPSRRRTGCSRKGHRTRFVSSLSIAAGRDRESSKGGPSDAGSNIRRRKSRRIKSARIVSSRRLLAGRELSFGRANLFTRQCPASRLVETRAYQATSVGALGHNAGVEFHLCPLEPHHQGS